MSHENDQVLSINLGKRSSFTDKEKLVYGYHYLDQGRLDDAKKLLGQISSGYMATTLYKDLSRALLCWATYKHTGNESHRKESEFYLVVYRLTKLVLKDNVMFKNSGHFHDLKETLFKDFKT